MVTKIIKIKESAYNALKAQKRSGESYSDLLLRVTEGKEKGVREFLQTIDPAMRSEIADSVKSAKRKLDRGRSRKVLL